jgi:hypothetical protein
MPSLLATILAVTDSLLPINGISIPSSASSELVHLSMLEISIRDGPVVGSHKTGPLS